MKHTYIGIASIVLALIVLPQTALAAWWNPFSWFSKNDKAPVNVSSRAEVATTTKASQSNLEPKNADTKTVPPKASSVKKPVVIKIEPPVVTKPNTPVTVTPPQSNPATTSKEENQKPEVKIVDAPTYALDIGFTPATFSHPRTIRNGLVAFSASATHGSGQEALGLWYLDRITFRIISERFRSGDMNVSIYSKGVFVADVSIFNEKQTVAISGHAASDDITFMINGQVPSHGDFKVIVDEISGYMKNDATKTVHPFKGTPLEAPRFDI